MRDGLIVSLLSVIPRRATSRAMGWGARRRWGRWAVRAFVGAYGVDLSESVVPDGGFDTLDAVFTRRLQPGARPIDPDPTAVVSPVDGVATYAGPVLHDRCPVAPGIDVSMSALLGETGLGGVDAAVLYLSPRDYHRVHAPMSGWVTQIRSVAGTRWPVFPGAQRWVPELLARNERVVIEVEGAHRWWLVLIGAFGVGHIECTVAVGDRVVPGQDVGAFRLGSTVVVVVPRGMGRFSAGEGPVRMGHRIGLVDAASTK